MYFKISTMYCNVYDEEVKVLYIGPSYVVYKIKQSILQCSAVSLVFRIESELQSFKFNFYNNFNYL